MNKGILAVLTALFVVCSGCASVARNQPSERVRTALAEYAKRWSERQQADVAEQEAETETADRIHDEEARDLPEWSDCTKASCWFGSNAGTRIMNILSPRFSDDQFRERVDKAVARGVNTFHLILCNQGDGEGAGYWPSVAVLDRVRELSARGYGIVLWLVTDDSNGYWATICEDTAAFIAQCKPFFSYASTIVLGLEMDEYGSKAQWTALRDALRKEWDGPIGTHHRSGRADFADLGDILFYQVDPGLSASQIKAAAKEALSHGKPVNFFELERHEARELAQAALDAGCFGVGNW